MVTFPSQDDQRYKDVSREIKRWVKQLREQAEVVSQGNVLS
jgi:hypothetical protein